MAERLETIVSGAGQRKTHGFAQREPHHKAKSIGDLKREIIALKNDCKTRTVTHDHGQDEWRNGAQQVQQEMLAKIRVLESKVVRYEQKISKRDDCIDQLKDELSCLQNKLLEIGQQMRTAESEKDKALRRAAAAEEEFECIKSSFDRDVSKIRRLQEDLDRAEVLAEDLESKREKSDELYLLEKNRRMELEQRLVESDDMLQSLRMKLDTMKAKMLAEKDSFHEEFGALRQHVATAQSEALESKKYATEQAEQLLSVVSQREGALKEISNLKRALNESKATADMYLHRATLAEEAAAEATAQLHKLQITSQTTTSKSSNEKMHVEMEVKALKEVLKSVTASAQAKDEELVGVSTLYEQEKASWADREASYKQKISILQQKIDQAEKLSLEERQKFESLKQDITRDRQEHLEALHELETAHTAQIDATTCDLIEKTNNLEVQLRNTEDMLMVKEEEIEQLRHEQEVAQMRASEAQQKVQRLDNALQSMKEELRESQEEVEALLTARLNQEISKAKGTASSVHPDEQWLFSEESVDEPPVIREVKSLKETKKSPMKKLAAYVRRKASPVKKPKQLNVDPNI